MSPERVEFVFSFDGGLSQSGFWSDCGAAKKKKEKWGFVGVQGLGCTLWHAAAKGGWKKKTKKTKKTKQSKKRGANAANKSEYGVIVVSDNKFSEVRTWILWLADSREIKFTNASPSLFSSKRTFGNAFNWPAKRGKEKATCERSCRGRSKLQRA